MGETSPAFQFYARDWLADSKVNRLSLAGRGLYFALICMCWMDGSIPDDPNEVAASIANTTPKEVLALWPKVRERFVPGPEPGTLIQARLEAVRAKQNEYHAKQSASGKVGGERSAASRKAKREAEGSLENASSESQATLPASAEGSLNPATATASATAKNDEGAGAAPRPPRGKAVEPEVEPGPTFGAALEAEVVSFVALLAGENKSGKILETRIASERRKLAELVAKHGEEAVLHGLREALRCGAGNVGYVRSCAVSYDPAKVRHLSSAPSRVRPGENAARDFEAEIFGSALAADGVEF
jgi:uncharacterized protein YdaU (DUF1376 family)